LRVPIVEKSNTFAAFQSFWFLLSLYMVQNSNSECTKRPEIQPKTTKYAEKWVPFPVKVLHITPQIQFISIALVPVQ